MNTDQLNVGLLDSYTGGNFGDGAVQDALIANLLQRSPGCSISLITLSPARTTAIHGLPSHPLTTAVFLSHTRTLKDVHRNAETKQTQAGPVRSRHIHKSLLRFRKPWRIAKAPFIFIRRVSAELRHILYCRRLLRSLRLLIVSGGGQLDDYWGGPMGHPYVLLKWAVLARLTGVPIAFLSVGVDRLEHRTSRFFIRIALKLAAYRSYRDAGSKALLADMPFTAADPVTPDLAFSFAPGLSVQGPTAIGQGAPLRIGVSPMAYMLKGHWPRENAAIFEPYYESLVALISELMRLGHEVTLFATADADNVVTLMLFEKIRESLTVDQSSKIKRIQAGTLRDLLPEMVSLDFVVASRLHGVILPHVCCLPVLAISYDRKVTSHMHTVGQDRNCVDIHVARVADLIKICSSLFFELPGVRAKLIELNKTYEDALAHQYDHIARFLGSSNTPSI